MTDTLIRVWRYRPLPILDHSINEMKWPVPFLTSISPQTIRRNLYLFFLPWFVKPKPVRHQREDETSSSTGRQSDANTSQKHTPTTFETLILQIKLSLWHFHHYWCLPNLYKVWEIKVTSAAFQPPQPYTLKHLFVAISVPQPPPFF